MNKWEQQERKRETERQREEEAARVKRVLGRRLVDAGYKALLFKLHPDHGGGGNSEHIFCFA